MNIYFAQINACGQLKAEPIENPYAHFKYQPLKRKRKILTHEFPIFTEVKLFIIDNCVIYAYPNQSWNIYQRLYTHKNKEKLTEQRRRSRAEAKPGPWRIALKAANFVQKQNQITK